jgi:drug/metabolite transporter (DMT)-like permease
MVEQTADEGMCDAASERGGGRVSAGSGRTQTRDLTGYGLVAGSFVLMALTGTLVSWASAPDSLLLVVRFAIASVALAAIFARRRPWAGVLRRGLWPRLLLMGLADSAALLAYFFAIRKTGVAVATFLHFLMPVWVALLAPRLLKQPTERVVYVSLGVAISGLVALLAPSLSGEAVRLPPIGLAVGLGGGLAYAVFQLVVKGLTEELPSTTIVLCEVVLNTFLILPLALWQTGGVHVGARDLVAALVLGLVCTALAYTMWVEGVGRIRVQHSSILGYLVPVMAPLFAWLLLGQTVTAATVAGGVLVVAAGVIVIVFGRGEEQIEPPL